MSLQCPCLPEQLLGMEVGTEHTFHRGSSCSFLPLVPGTSPPPFWAICSPGPPHPLPAGHQGLLLPLQAPRIVVPSPTCPIATHPTDGFLWLPMLPWVLPGLSSSCPCSPSGLSSLHLGQDPGGFWPRLSVKLISHISPPPLAASLLPVTPSPHSFVCNECGVSKFIQGNPFLPILSD